MPQQISADITRICKVCGDEFHPTARKQACCNKLKDRVCPICGHVFQVKCTTTPQKETCSQKCQVALIKQKRAQSASQQQKQCKWCGKLFTPKSARDAYCDDVHYKTCVICGKQFEIDVRRDSSVQTCSNECKQKLSMQHRDTAQEQMHLRETMQKKYGVSNPMQSPAIIEKLKQANREKYGTDWYAQTDEAKEQIRRTSLEKYGTEHFLSSEQVKRRRKETCEKKYGKFNVLASAYGRTKTLDTMLKKYGIINPSQYPEFKKKATRSAKASNLEKRICDLLVNYGIKFEQHYIIKRDDVSHEFDFYLPEYKMLIDADGLYYHGYLDDPNGKQVLEYYDDIRISLVPEGCRFHVIVEGNEDKQMKELVKVLDEINGDLSKYDSILLEWCKSIEFPYPSYTEGRMLKDWAHLCQYEDDTYRPQCRLGQSIIKNFHKSIYSSRVGNNCSPLEGWHDENILRRVIKNRLIYKNDVDPSKILAGFSISKICPVVSTFNPVLARYLTKKYLSEFHIVFDPFSGFSGRLLGVCSTGKQYIGQDLNVDAVNESNQIINLLQVDGQISNKNILDSDGQYECLLTCPPYFKKETYNSEQDWRTCDDWIDECLQRFDCRAYVFVVDSTNRYSKYITETIKSTSHFSDVEEKVVVIRR